MQKRTTKRKEFYSITQICDELEISRATVYRLMKKGELYFYKLGGRRKVRLPYHHKTERTLSKIK
jgi:excisionase family DNA binding protein